MAMLIIAHFLFMTRLLDGDMQLTLMSVVPCRLQIAIEKRPKFARITFERTYLEKRMTIIIIIIIIITIITLIVWSAAHDMVSFSPSHLYAVLYFVPSGPTPVKMKRFKIFRISYSHFFFSDLEPIVWIVFSLVVCINLFCSWFSDSCKYNILPCSAS